ncbi:heterokaryon incompatibility, partial [Microdochium bolleyi]
DSPLYGDLVVRDLAKTSSYVALSYVWGQSDPQNPRSIYIRKIGSPGDGIGQISITENGHQALWHIRKKFGPTYIWIDAICINQGDLAERSHQVQWMGDIYSSAQRVYVFLGVGDLGTDRAMQYLRAVGNSSERMP